MIGSVAFRRRRRRGEPGFNGCGGSSGEELVDLRRRKENGRWSSEVQLHYAHSGDRRRGRRATK